MKINVGCGKRTDPDWWNCDVQQDPDASQPLDAICDARSIPLPNECADVVQAIHLFEHLYRWEIDSALAEWRRLLKPKGTLILELPNLVKCCQNYLSGRVRGGKEPDQLSRWGIYGDPRTGNHWMNHRWGYSPAELIDILHARGFVKAKEHATQFHPAGREYRDMRIEARKA
ncbi:MAG: methyltransferase domain-containing protein [Gallionella sp.]